MDYTILILALPLLSFLVLALAGMKMPHRVAGAIGTLSLGAVAVLSYLTAFSYFTAERTAEVNLPDPYPVEHRLAAVHPTAAHRHGNHAGSHFRDDADCHLYRQPDGTYLFFRLYER